MRKNHFTTREVSQHMKFLRVLGNRAVLFVLLTIAVAAGVYMVLTLAQGASVTCTANAAANLTTCRSTNGAGIDEDGDGRVDEDPLDGVDNDGDGNTDEDPSGGDEDDTTLPIDAVAPRVAGLPTVFTDNGDSALIEADDNSAVFPNANAVCNGFCLGGGNDTAYIRDPGGVAANKNPIEVFGEDGDDTIIDHSLGAGNNELQGGNGNDVLIGDASERLVGGAGNDLLAGGAGADTFGGTVAADLGDDTFVGGQGTDLYGNFGAGDGNDFFILQAGDVPAGANELIPCNGTDTIFLVGFNFDGTRVYTPVDDDGAGGFDDNPGLGGADRGFVITDPVTGGTYEIVGAPTNAAGAVVAGGAGTDVCTIIGAD
jgi:Ca2+-binding RTX toxin-like protein